MITVPLPREPAATKAPSVEYERVAIDAEAHRDWSATYRTSRVEVYPTHELHTPEARPALRKVIRQVAATEGPVHVDLLVQRAREAWGLARAGSRIRDNVRVTVGNMIRGGKLSADGAFYDVLDRDELKARRPDDGTTPRKVIHIAPVERHLALCELAAECPGMSEDELIRSACEFFGWRRMGKDIRECLQRDIADLFDRRMLTGGPDRINAGR